MTGGWNTRYLAYTRAHGHSDPEEMLAADERRWPGGPMFGFTLWMDDQWTAFYGGKRPLQLDLSDAGQAKFDAWLNREPEQLELEGVL